MKRKTQLITTIKDINHKKIPDITPELQEIAKYYKIGVEDLLHNIDIMKRQEIIDQHPYEIFQTSDKRWRTYISDETKPNSRRAVSRTNLDDLYNDIVKVYRQREAKENLGKMHLEIVYEKWILWRRDMGTDPNTIKKDLSNWKRYVLNAKEYAIADYVITNITKDILENFFLEITKNHALSHKQLANLRSTLSGVFKYAVKLRCVPRSIIFDVDYKQFRTRCKPDDSKKDAYTDEERKKILLYLENKTDVYSLAISFAFRLCLRIGELQALKKTDVVGCRLKVERSIRRNQTINDDLSFNPISYVVDERNKGNTTAGKREVTLSPQAQKIAIKTIKLYPDGDYLFMYNGKPILGRMFNENLKRVCEILKIKYRPSHQIRFTTATNLAEAGVPINQLSYELGHSDVKTTFEYTRQRKADARSQALIAQVQDI